MKDLVRGSSPAGDRSVHGTVVAANIGGFASKEQCIVYRRCQGFLRTALPGLSVAIRAARERIVLPVVEVSMLKQTFEFLGAESLKAMKLSLIHILSSSGSFTLSRKTSLLFGVDLDLLGSYVQSEMVINAHVLVGDPDGGEKCDHIAAPIVVKQCKARRDQEGRSDIWLKQYSPAE